MSEQASGCLWVPSRAMKSRGCTECGEEMPKGGKIWRPLTNRLGRAARVCDPCGQANLIVVTADLRRGGEKYIKG